MSRLTVSIPHKLPRAEARRRIQEQVAQLQAHPGGTLSRLEHRWTGDTLDFTAVALGQTVTGQVFVEDQAVRLEVVLPWMLAMLANLAKPKIEQKGRELLESH
jgi:putative polyhydroxyalkanoate system protein